MAHSSQLRVLNLDYNPLGKLGAGEEEHSCLCLCDLHQWVARDQALERW